MFFNLAKIAPANSPSGDAIGNEGTCDGRIESNKTFDDNAVPSFSQQLASQHMQLEDQFSGQEHDPLMREFMWVSHPLSRRSLSMVCNFFSNTGTHFLRCLDTTGSTKHVLGAPAPQGVAFCEKQSFRQQPSSKIVHDIGQKKVKVSCTFPGCSTRMRKDGLTRHLNEVHFRVVKGVCARCGKAFQRPYLKWNHEITCRG